MLRLLATGSAAKATAHVARGAPATRNPAGARKRTAIPGAWNCFRPHLSFCGGRFSFNMFFLICRAMKYAYTKLIGLLLATTPAFA